MKFPKKYRFNGKNPAYRVTNAIFDAAPMHIWGKGCPGKGGKTTNAPIPEKKQ